MLGVLAPLALWSVVVSNALVRSRNKVDEAWSGIDVQLKRRHDVVPDLVEALKGYASHERETLQDVTVARFMERCDLRAASGQEELLMRRLFARPW